MASNESAYIADFIHHHVYKGFSNIFVGINGTSHDATKLIVERVSSRYPSVRLVDTNRYNSSPGMYSCSSYALILEAARANSDSDFFLPIDVDEFFMSRTLGESVSLVLSPLLPFDCLTLTYIDQTYAEKAYSEPLNFERISTATNMWTKSVVSYQAPVVRIEPHIPCFDVSLGPDALTVIDANSARRVPLAPKDETFTYGNILEHALPLSSYLEIPFIFHYRQRSALEYSLRCLRPWPESTQYFYTNREGYCNHLMESESTAVLRQLLSASSYEAYLASRVRFLQECDIHELTIEAQRALRTSAVEDMIRSIPRQAVIDERATWSRTFRGTPFLDLLEQIAA